MEFNTFCIFATKIDMKSLYIHTKRALASVLLSVIMLPANGQTAEQNKTLDSLRAIYNSAKSSEERFHAMDTIAYLHYSADSTEYYAKILIDMAHKGANRYYEAKGYDYMSWANYFYGNYSKACEYAQKSLALSEQLNNAAFMANSYYLLGNAFARMQNHVKSNEYYYKALAIYQNQQDTSHICDVNRNIADNNYVNSMYDAAELCLTQALNLDKVRGDKVGLALDCYYIGRLAYKQYSDHKVENPDEFYLQLARSYFANSLKYAHEANHGYSQLRSSRELALTITDFADNERVTVRKNEMLDTSKIYLDEAYKMCSLINNVEERLATDEVKLYWLITKHKYESARRMLDSLQIAIGESTEAGKEYIPRFCLMRAKLYSSMGQYQQANYYTDLYHELYRNSRQADFIARSAQLMEQAKYDQKLREHEMAYMAESQLHRTITISVIIGLLMVLIFTGVTIYYYLRVRRINRVLDINNSKLRRQKREIEQQKVDLEEQNKKVSAYNKEMTSSIHYASLIQRAVMPSEEQMNELFGEHALVYRPLDIVSGDFYWAAKVGRLKMLVVADCTGHGVPGAILSMLGVALLNDMTSRIDVDSFSAGKLLDEMREVLKRSLRQFGGVDDNHDGIDLSFVVVDPEYHLIHYAGAYRPLVIIRRGRMTVVEPNKMPIGTHFREADCFTEKVITYEENDILYMYTDGVTDQFGYGNENEVMKYGIPRLQELLMNVSHETMGEQQKKLESAFDNWRTDRDSMLGEKYEQIDDSLILGIKLTE